MKNQHSTITKNPAFKGFSLKGILALALLITCSAPVLAQDKIIFKDGTEADAKITEVTPNELKYKSFNYLDGPIHIVSKQRVFKIKFENGMTEVFGLEPQPIIIAAPTPTQDPDYFVRERQQKYDGPRFGLTFITPGTEATRLSDNSKSPFITQFGWQFEKRLFNIDKGPSGILEFVPVIGGMEQGLFLPSASMLIGMRGDGKRAFEFAVGPNVSVTGLGMVFAFGTSFRHGNINFPVNLAFVPSVGSKSYNASTNSYITNQTGHRITLTIGFNMRKE